jgi:hypothetical protein
VTFTWGSQFPDKKTGDLTGNTKEGKGATGSSRKEPAYMEIKIQPERE